jgi:hypothetical protein
MQEQALAGGLYEMDSDDDSGPNLESIVAREERYGFPPLPERLRDGLFGGLLGGRGEDREIEDRLMGIRMDIERLMQEGVGLDRNPFADLDDPMAIFGAPPRHVRDRERERVN